MRKETRGLTLIEVLIIVVMVGILLTIIYQKTRGRTAKDVIATLKVDVENTKAAESKYYAAHNVYGTRAQLDTAKLITETPGNSITIVLHATGYLATATFLNAFPLTCSADVTGGEEGVKTTKTVCNQ